FSVKVGAQGKDAEPVLSPKLRGKRGQKAGQHVSRTAFRKRGAARCVNPRLSIRRGKDRVKALEYDMRVEELSGLTRGAHTIGLYPPGVCAQETGHLPRMWRDSKKMRFAFAQ